jgi:hypothetical protein
MNVSTLHIAKNRKISPYEHLCLLSFARKGYAVNLFTYDCNCSLPDFVAVRDASEIIPEHNVFENAHEKGSFSMFSNLFRYHLLSRIDTTWIDTDVILLADALPSGHFLYGFQDDCRKTVNGAILKAPHSSPLLRRLVQECRGEPEHLTWGRWGPKLITRVACELGVADQALPSAMLYPVGWPDALAPFAPKSSRDVAAATSGSSTLHLWNEILRRYLPDYPSRGPSSGSFLANLLEKWGLKSLFKQFLTEEDIFSAERRLLASHPHAATRRKFPLGSGYSPMDK